MRIYIPNGKTSGRTSREKLAGTSVVEDHDVAMGRRDPRNFGKLGGMAVSLGQLPQSQHSVCTAGNDAIVRPGDKRPYSARVALDKEARL
jgi:hypothetical protein